MRIINVLLAATFVAVGVTVPGAHAAEGFQTTDVSTDDHALESRIKARIQDDASLAGYAIGVDLNEGVATIEGTVRNESQRTRALRLATIRGVKRVRNEIVVDPTANPAAGKVDRSAAKVQAGTDKAFDAAKKGTGVAVEKTKEGTTKAVDATKKAVEKTVGGATVAKDAGQNVGQKVGEAFSDGWITTKVKGKIVDDTLMKGSDIKVKTDNHVVTLSGTVASAEAKARAEEIARTTDGVKEVVSLLVVNPA